MTYDTLLDFDTAIRILIQIIGSLALLRFIYYKSYTHRDTLHGFMAFGYGVFLICRLLSQVQLSLGFAFGLFAVLSMLRYRTEAMSVRDMTYLFLTIVISLVCAVAPLNMIELAGVVAFVCGLTFVLETSQFAPRMSCRNIVYDNLDNIGPDQYPQLLEEVSARTGIDIIEIKIDDIDYLKDTANLCVFYQSR